MVMRWRLFIKILHKQCLQMKSITSGYVS